MTSFTHAEVLSTWQEVQGLGDFVFVRRRWRDKTESVGREPLYLPSLPFQSQACGKRRTDYLCPLPCGACVPRESRFVGRSVMMVRGKQGRVY